MRAKIFAIPAQITRPALLFGVATWFLSFGYQVAFYSLYAYEGSKFLQGQRNVFSYYSGVIGDGLIVPVINSLVFILLKEIGVKITLRKFIFFLVLGLLTTLGIHYEQATAGLTNWAMPEPFFWSGIGRFHFLFMLSEFAFLFFSLGEIVRHWRTVTGSSRQLVQFALIWLTIGAFLATFVIDYSPVLHWR